MRISDWSSDVCSSDLFSREAADFRRQAMIDATAACLAEKGVAGTSVRSICMRAGVSSGLLRHYFDGVDALIAETYRATSAQLSETVNAAAAAAGKDRSEEDTSEIQSLMRNSVAVFCLEKKKTTIP